jgi:hypothetical protein
MLSVQAKPAPRPLNSAKKRQKVVKKEKGADARAKKMGNNSPTLWLFFTRISLAPLKLKILDSRRPFVKRHCHPAILKTLSAPPIRQLNLCHNRPSEPFPRERAQTREF